MTESMTEENAATYSRHLTVLQQDVFEENRRIRPNPQIERIMERQRHEERDAVGAEVEENFDFGASKINFCCDFDDFLYQVLARETAQAVARRHAAEAAGSPTQQQRNQNIGGMLTDHIDAGGRVEDNTTQK